MNGANESFAEFVHLRQPATDLQTTFSSSQDQAPINPFAGRNELRELWVGRRSPEGASARCIHAASRRDGVGGGRPQRRRQGSLLVGLRRRRERRRPDPQL